MDRTKEFKVGDRVKVKDLPDWLKDLPAVATGILRFAGKKCIITEISDDSYRIDIDSDHRYSWWDCDFVLLDKTEKDVTDVVFAVIRGK